MPSAHSRSEIAGLSVAGLGADLLPDDDAGADASFGRLDCGGGHVVVGDEDDVESFLLDSLRQLVDGGDRVTRQRRVQVAVDPDEAAAARGDDPPEPPAH